MSMSLFAVRTTWIGALIVIAFIFLLLFMGRAFVDFAKWFKEEIIDDIRDRKGKGKGRR